MRLDQLIELVSGVSIDVQEDAYTFHKDTPTNNQRRTYNYDEIDKTLTLDGKVVTIVNLILDILLQRADGFFSPDEIVVERD